MALLTSPAFVFTFTVFLAFLIWQIRRRGNTARQPPGPKGLPIIGNVLDIPKSHEWFKYAEWSQQYNSDIISLKLMNTPVLVINSAKAVVELMEQRSAIYSDRPRSIMLTEFLQLDWNFGFMPYGDTWREHNRLFHRFFNPRVVKTYRPRITREVKVTLGRLLESPDKFMEHFRHMAGSLILSVTYGINVLPHDDPYIEIAEKGLQVIEQSINAGAYLVDGFPMLLYLPHWFPGAGFKRRANEWRRAIAAMADAPLAYAKKAMAEGQCTPSLVSSSLMELDSPSDEDTATREKVIRRTAATAYAGGADTSVSALGSFVLAMVLYPDVQRKAREELDSVVGRDRLPNLDDECSLPFVTALVREVLRWQTVAPLGIPHRLTTDDNYRGYHLKAGTFIVPNIWAILHDPCVYPDPETFNPHRFLDDKGMLDPRAPDPTEHAFGYGRRTCPGRHFLLASLWQHIASILATFEIHPAKDQSGCPVFPSLEYTSGVVSFPVPYRCQIVPRSSEVGHLFSGVEERAA